MQTIKFLIVEPSPFPILIPQGPDNYLSILFSNTLNLHSSLIVRDHVSQPYSTTGNIIVLEIGINADYWVDSAHDRDYWTALVNAALNLRVT